MEKRVEKDARERELEEQERQVQLKNALDNLNLDNHASSDSSKKPEQAYLQAKQEEQILEGKLRDE